jgi:uncharacterized membrane protein
MQTEPFNLILENIQISLRARYSNINKLIFGLLLYYTIMPVIIIYKKILLLLQYFNIDVII